MTNKRVIWATVVVISLFLVGLGIKIPDLSQPHQPKPRHRAVIEAPHKVIKAVGAKTMVSIEAVAVYTIARPPVVYAAYLLQEIRQPSFQPVHFFSARAPPAEQS